jgi:hypothetical protein
MSRPSGSIGQALKNAAIRFAREAERYVGANDATPCTCSHPRSEHCGCGTSCLGYTVDESRAIGMRRCECEGFTEKGGR